MRFLVTLVFVLFVKLGATANCPSGWKGFGNKCYFFSTNRLTWTQAEDDCRVKGGHLAKDTRDVHSFLSAEVAKLDISACSPIWMCNLYIGLIYRPGQGYKWSDGTAVDESFMPWKRGEPNDGNVEKSAEIELRSSDYSNFRWNDRALNWRIPESWYICEKPEETVSNCQSNWKGFGNKCYYFSTNRLTWSQAEDYCQDEGGHLAKDTRDVHSFLSAEVSKLDISACSPIWMCNLYIGLIYRPGQGYKWSDGTAVDQSFMPWKRGEPNDGNVEKSAEIELRSSDYSNFRWNDRALNWRIPESWFICEKPEETISLLCDVGWKLFGTKCYYFSTSRLTWTQAEDYCQDEGGHLAKDTRGVHSFLSAEVSKLDISACSPIWMCNLYIGLVYRPGQGYKWSDGTAVDQSFMPWQPGEPNDGEVAKSAEFELRSSDYSNFRWNDRALNWRVPDSWFICEKQAGTPQPPPTEAPPTEAPPTEAPPTEAPPTEAPPTEAPPTEAPPTEAPPTEAPPTEAPPTEAPPEPTTEYNHIPETTYIPTLPPCEFPPGIQNVARGKQASQSSDKPKKDGAASNAVDGNYNSDVSSGACSWTNKEYQPWWKVDLGRAYDIYEIVITNRGDCCPFRIKSGEIRVGNSANFNDNPVCGMMILGRMAKEQPIHVRCGCETPMSGRYVSIQLIDREQQLHMCEFEVMAL